MPMPPFGARLAAALQRSSGLCVGIDPHPATLDAWGLPQSAEGVHEFAVAVLDACDGLVGVVKPQVSLFERFGARGFAVLEQTLADARNHGLLTIADAKRADIGSSNRGYADAWLAADAPFSCDALTVSPYLGVGALTVLRDTALSSGAGLFVLAATSNPEADALQSAVRGGLTTAQHVAAEVAAWNEAADAERAGGPEPLGSFGIVFGATGAPVARGLDIRCTPSTLPILAPGFGHQGARLSGAGTLFSGCGPRLVANVSRSITGSGAAGVRSNIDAARNELLEGLH